MDGLDKKDSHECKDKTYRAWLCELANEVWALKEKVERLEDEQANRNTTRSNGHCDVGSECGNGVETNWG